MKLKLKKRERDTVLAALRYWRRCEYIREDLAEYDIATDGGTLRPLTNPEIDDLCERLNR